METGHMKKTAYVQAFFENNLGDDLFVVHLVRSFPDVQFVLQCPRQYAAPFLAYPNVRIEEPLPPTEGNPSIQRRIQQKIRRDRQKKAAGSIYIGGSVLIEYPNWQQILNWWEYQSQNTKFCLCGANFGPYSDPAYLKRFHSIAADMQLLTFRDHTSWEKFSDLPQAHCIPDILFSLPMPEVKREDDLTVISVINLEQKEEGSNSLSQHARKYEDAMTEMINRLNEQGSRTILLSFSIPQKDGEAARRILDRVNDSEMNEIIEYDGHNTQQILTLLAKASQVISARFHGVVLALAAGTPVIPVIYSAKTSEMLKDIGFQGRTWDFRTEDAEGTLFGSKPAGTLDEASLNALKTRAQQHFQKLGEVLNTSPEFA